MALPTKEKDLRRSCALLRARMVEGTSAEAIRDEMGYSIDEFNELMARFYEMEAQALREKSTERVYTEYVLHSETNIAALSDLITELKDNKQHSSVIGAIKAKQEIMNQVIARGQEFGFVEKRAEPKMITGILVNNMTDAQIRKAVLSEATKMSKFIENFSQDNSTILDVAVGELYPPTPKQKALDGTSIKNRAKSSRVHGGRRVVKG